MTEISVQASFNSGEWSPNLFARVDLDKWHSAAALLENFFVDYRGGASTRSGSQYIIQAYKSATQVRLIPFQASFNVGYVLEFGNGYIRFIFNGSPVLETAFNMSAATKANPCVITAAGHNFVAGDWVYITGVSGMTQLNGRYFRVQSVAGNNITLGDLNGVNLDSTAFGTYTANGTVARIYTLASPYTSVDDLRLLKYAQSVDQMVICHPNHPVYILTIIAANNWTLLTANIGSSIAAPAAPTVATTLAGGNVNYSYVVTAIDSGGQESNASPGGALATTQDIRSVAGSNTITWTAVPGAVAYNVYEATVTYGAAVPANVQYGFIGTSQGTTFIDSNIAQDFSLTPPIAQNPFDGFGIASVTVTNPGIHTSVPTVSFSGMSFTPAYATATLGTRTDPTISAAGTGYAVDDIIFFPNSLSVRVTSIGGFTGTGVTGWTRINPGTITSGSTPANPFNQISTTGSGTGAQGSVQWGVRSVEVQQHGSGFLVAPTVVFTAGAPTAVATAVLQTSNQTNPTVPGFVQQRLVLASSLSLPATFYMSKPGQYFNFDKSNPVTPGDSVAGTLVSGTLHTIQSIVGSAAGMIILTDKAVWLVNGGSVGAAITPISPTANPQSYIGASDVPPITINYDILFVESKSSKIRSLSYNVYYNVFTGMDVSLLSSHLFYNHTVVEWCWAEQPWYTAHAVREDGWLLTLTFIKEQEFIGWSHYVTDGSYISVASVTETVSGINLDAVYTIVERSINGNTVQYIERFTERTFPNGYIDAWCVDSGLQYSGSPATTFTGAEHLAGKTVTGLADGVVITPFVMPTSGIFTLGSAASKVTVGLAFTCKLQTLPLEAGAPSVQGQPKKIQGVNIRVADTLGLSIGASFDTLTDMHDLQLGEVSSTLTGQPSQIVTDLVTGDAFTVLNPTYTIQGQYCIQQSTPYPATILGCFPQFAMEQRKWTG